VFASVAAASPEAVEADRRGLVLTLHGRLGLHCKRCGKTFIRNKLRLAPFRWIIGHG